MKKFSLVSGFLALVLLTACSQVASNSPAPAATPAPTEPTAQAQTTPEPAQVVTPDSTPAPKNTVDAKVKTEVQVKAATPPTTTPPPTTAPTATPAPAATTPTVATFNVSGGSFFFTPSTMNVKKGDKVRIVFTNAGGMHNLTLDAFGVATRTLSTGESQTVEFIASKSGSFEYYCNVGSHRAMGQKGTLIVQ
jgi:plastocyanin